MEKKKIPRFIVGRNPKANRKMEKKREKENRKGRLRVEINKK